MTHTIFERYGGFASVSRVVLDFYNKILDSPVTSPYFAGIDMRRLIDHQTLFIASIMGGPASYTDEHLERVHTGLGITEDAFMEVLALLKETLKGFEYADGDIRVVEDEILSRKQFIIART